MEVYPDEKVEFPSPVATSTTAWSRDLEGERRASIASPPLSPLARLSEHIQSRRQERKSRKEENTETYGPIIRKLDTCPGGYCKVATFQSSDPNFLQYRGFSYLHCRLLSSLQYEIVQLETELDKLDEWEQENDDPGNRLVCKQFDDKATDVAQFPESFRLKRFHRTRPQLFQELRVKLLEYDEVLLKTKEMSALQKPSNRDYQSVKAWFMNNEPTVYEEFSYLRRREDMVTLRNGRESAGFEGLIERLLSGTDHLLQKANCNVIRDLFMTAELREKTDDPDIRYYAPARVDTLVGLVITMVIFVLLLIPVFSMFILTEFGTKASAFEAIAILLLFTLLFAFAMSLLTKAKRHELFAASAAYCGVLIVFIGSFNTQDVKVVSA